jgi:hypothetical protein
MAPMEAIDSLTMCRWTRCHRRSPHSIWGSAITHHPHVHMIVPGGGLSPDGKRWIATKPNFFLPVLVLSRLFRRLMLEKLSAAHEAGKLTFFGAHAHLADDKVFAGFLAPLKKRRWFVYSKRPFAGPKAVLAYLSRYTHRVAISNGRLIAADEKSVTFKVKDYRVQGPGRYTTMTSPRTSSSAASCCTSCPRASTASDTTAFSPGALVARASRRRASFWRSPRAPQPIPRMRLAPMTQPALRSPPRAPAAAAA